MKTIIVLAEKGGVGKTMIADEITFSLERSDVPVAFHEIDRQGGELHTGPPVMDPMVQVVDTPGYVSKGRDAWIEEADLVIIPTEPGGNSEKEPFINTLVACYKKNKDVLVLLNKKTGNKSSKELSKALSELPFDVEVISIPRREDIVKASLKHKSVVEYKRNSDAAKQVLKAVNRIREKIGFFPEER